MRKTLIWYLKYIKNYKKFKYILKKNLENVHVNKYQNNFLQE